MPHKVKYVPAVRQFERYRTFMLTLEMDNDLKARAKKRKCSVGELIRLYLDWGLEIEEKAK